MYAQSPPVETVHDFFKQQRTLNFQQYLKQKEEEKTAAKRIEAAIKIQSAFRGWLVRSNFKLVQAAAIKIQSLFRRGIAKNKFNEKLQARKDKLDMEMRNKAATKIQAAWRGYQSRKNYFDFKKYKAIQKKNSELEKSIKRKNKLESALEEESGEQSETSRQSGQTKDRGSKDDENSEDLDQNEIADEDDTDTLTQSLIDMSPSQIHQLFNGAIDGRTSSQGSRELIRMRDSIESMFPEMPDGVDLVRPDPEKAKLLANAIRLLRKNAKKREDEKLYKQHYLMRTAAVPGVYSDIFTNEPTEMEKKFKGLKFLKTELPHRNPCLKKGSTEQLRVIYPEPIWKHKGSYPNRRLAPIMKPPRIDLSEFGNSVAENSNNNFCSMPQRCMSSIELSRNTKRCFRF